MAHDQGPTFSTLVSWLVVAHERELACCRAALNPQVNGESEDAILAPPSTTSGLRHVASAKDRLLPAAMETPPDIDTVQLWAPLPPLEPAEDLFQRLPGEVKDEPDPAPVLPETVSIPPSAAKLGTLEIGHTPTGEADAEHPRTMTVNIVSARGLRNADWAVCNLSDPYVICELVQRQINNSNKGQPRATWQSDVKYNTLEPVWNTTFQVEDVGSTEELIFKVYDKNVGSSDAFLGWARLPSNHMNGRGFDGDLQLLDAGKDINAYLRVCVVFDDASDGGELRCRSTSSNIQRQVNSRTSLRDLPIRPIWQIDDTSSLVSSWMVHSSSRLGSQPDDMVCPTENEAVCMSTSYLQRFICFPGSRPRIAWDLMAGILIIYDSITIPLQVFHISDDGGAGRGGFLGTMDLITLVFWTLHMVASVLVGYEQKGITEMRPKKVLRYYLKTWFLVDLLAVVPDWIFSIKALTSDTESSSGRSVRLLRIFRLFRTVRLVRLLKLRTIIAGLHDLLSSEYSSILANIFKMIMMLLFINHYLACVWYLVAYVQLGSRPTWLDEHNFDSSPWEYQYLTAFHFSITQFTPASMHVQPQNVGERAFTIGLVIFALVGFSYLVGSITNSLTQLRGMSEDVSKQFWILRRYLYQNNVPTELGIRIQHYLEHAWQRKTSRISEPSLFSLLSEQLKNELQCARSLPHLVVHPLFQYLKETSDNSLQRLAVDAIRWQSLARADHLFFPGEIATQVYFVVAGTLRYSRLDKDGMEHVEWVDRSEDWIAEPVLWTPSWVHLGTLIAMNETDLLILLGGQFGEIMARTPQVHSLVSSYATNFMAWMNSVGRDSLSDVSQGEIVSSKLRNFIPDVDVPG